MIALLTLSLRLPTSDGWVAHANEDGAGWGVYALNKRPRCCHEVVVNACGDVSRSLVLDFYLILEISR